MTRERRWAALLVVVLGAFMDQLDASIVTVALVPIQRDLDAPAELGQLIVIGYTLSYALTLVTGGRLGDIMGHRRTFLIGVTGFTLASAVAGAATGPAMLVAARVAQGIFGGIMTPQVMSMIATRFPAGPERAKAFVVTSLLLGGATVGGPVAGGLLMHALGWRSIFFINIPVGIIAFLGALRWIPESRAQNPPRVDLPGVGILAVGSLLLLIPLLQGRELGWPPLLAFCLGAAPSALMIFYLYEQRRERRGRDPLVPVRLVRRRPFYVATTMIVLINSALGCYFLAMAWGLQAGLMWSPLKTALTLLALPLGIAVTMQAANNHGAQHGRAFAAYGTLTMMGGMCGLITAFSYAGAEVTPLAVAPWLFVTGVGMGLSTPVLPNVALADLPERDAGAASGVVNSATMFGAAVGASVAGTIFYLGGTPETAAGHVHAAARTLWYDVALLAAAGALAALLPGPPPAKVREPAGAVRRVSRSS